MSRLGLDGHAAADLNPRRELAEPEAAPAALLHLAAALLTDPSLPRASERERCAERLRRLARVVAAAEAAEQAGLRRQADADARRQR